MKSQTLDSEHLSAEGEQLSFLRLFTGASLLGVRQILVQGLGAGTGVLLAWKLSPFEFGLYAISTFFYYLCFSLGDLGLGASLIREKEVPRAEAYRAVLSVRQIIDAVVFVVIWVSAPSIAHFYQMAESEEMFFRIIAAAAFVSSFQIVPSIQLERSLEFSKLALVEILQSLAFSLVSLLLVFQDFGILSFAWGWLAFALVGATAAYKVHPWKLAWGLDPREILPRLAFALPFQGIGLLYLARDSVNPLLVGSLLGPTEVGYVNWAQMLGTFTALLFAVLQRAYLPAFAALQDRRAALGRMISKVLALSYAFNTPFALLSLFLAEPIVRFIFGEKWLPALPLFYCFWLANVFAPATYACLSAFNAIGQARMSFMFTLVSTISTWLLSVAGVFVFQGLGFALAYAIVQTGGLFLIWRLRAEVPFSFSSIFKLWWPAAFVLAWSILLTRGAVTSALSLAAFGLIQVLVYAIAVGLLYASQRSTGERKSDSVNITSLG